MKPTTHESPLTTTNLIKSVSITAAFVGIFSGLTGAFFKMFHMSFGNEMLIGSVALSAVAIAGMTYFAKKRKDNEAFAPVEIES